MSRSLSEEDMMKTMRIIMAGEMDDADLRVFLSDMAQRGESVAEITGAARVLRECLTPVKAPDDAVDCCGTGGDGASTYNISTAVALVAAACGVPMAKHGNRAASSKSGAADVLEALGVNLDAPHEKLEEALARLHFAFLMAPHHHPAMRHVRDVRKAMGTRTVFNLLGPLANPAGTKRQLIGVFSKDLLVSMAEVLRALGTEKAWVVHGSDGLDEITVTGPSDVAILENGQITQTTLSPEDFGLARHDAAALTGGDAGENARALKALLEGKHGAYRDIVLANAAAVLDIYGDGAPDLKGGALKAAEAIDSGRAMRILDDYIAFLRD